MTDRLLLNIEQVATYMRLNSQKTEPDFTDDFPTLKHQNLCPFAIDLDKRLV
jgi:hypothetical protein